MEPRLANGKGAETGQGAEEARNGGAEKGGHWGGRLGWQRRKRWSTIVLSALVLVSPPLDVLEVLVKYYAPAAYLDKLLMMLLK